MLTGVGVYLLENGRLPSDDTTGDKKTPPFCKLLIAPSGGVGPP